MTAKTYLNLRVGAPRRLAALRLAAADINAHRITQATWRNMRYSTFADSRGLSDGFNGEGRSREAVWVTFDRDDLPGRMSYVDKTEGAHVDHRGWYTRDDGDSGVYRGFILRLSHGRMLAGYHSTDNDEYVIYTTIYDETRECAYAADRNAELMAESERDYQREGDAARDCQDATETALQRLRECLALRNRACMAYVRDEIHELVETIRTNREKLAGEYAQYL